MRPIPRNLLPDTALVRVPDAAARRGGEYEDAVEVGRVRLDRNLSAGAHAAPYQLAESTVALLFVDAANSEGAFEVPAGSKASCDGGETWFLVEACHVFAPYGRVHHWELELRR